MYKVFINNKPIFFIENDEKVSKLNYQSLLTCITDKDRDLILEKHLLSEEEIYVIGNDFKKVWKLFFGNHKIVVAAGGVVLNFKNEVLFIYRNGFWDLPKGKVEKNEQIDTAAVREVEEECGIVAPVIEKKLLTTFHTFDTYGENCIKPTHWYLMRYGGTEKLTPQLEEGITKVKWIKRSEVASKLTNTFGSIVDVVKCYQNL